LQELYIFIFLFDNKIDNLEDASKITFYKTTQHPLEEVSTVSALAPNTS